MAGTDSWEPASVDSPGAQTRIQQQVTSKSGAAREAKLDLARAGTDCIQEN